MSININTSSRRIRAVAVSLVAFAMAGAVLIDSGPPAFADEGAVTSADAAAHLVDAATVATAAPVAVDTDTVAAAAADSSVKDIVVDAGASEASLPAQADAPVVLRSEGGESVGVKLPVSTARPRGTDLGPVVYQDKGKGVDAVVTVMDGSVQIAIVIDSRRDPLSYPYEVLVPDGGSVVRDGATGGVVIKDAAGTPIAGFAAPWAKDARGRSVPTWYEIKGNVVTQVVAPGPGATYPIVADPWFGKDLISSASWVRYTEGWTLQVTPTQWARSNAGSYAVGAAGWLELKAKYQNRGLNTNLTGMQDQYICHQQLVAVRDRNKATWNLDEWRPSVGYVQTVNSYCNPGGNKWFD